LNKKWDILNNNSEYPMPTFASMFFGSEFIWSESI